MAGTDLPEIYCWEIAARALNIFFASTRKGAARIGITLEQGMDCLDFFRPRFPKAALSKDYPLNRPLTEHVAALLSGKRPRDKHDLDISSTPFQRQVLKAITRIPYGKTKTYGEVAELVGRPNGQRAVGQVMARNPLPLLFP